ncbi:MAG TPA: PAS domain S-box protein, partial [Herpetosiphonaceae bacterium]
MTDPPPSRHPISDARVQEILSIVALLREGNQRGWPAGATPEAELEAAIAGLKSLTEALAGQRNAYRESERRLGEIMDVITSISFLDFSKRAPVGAGGDILDAVASGLNMLGEELVASTVSRAFFTQIIESMIETLIVLGPDASIKLVNRAALEMLGYAEDELLGQPMQKVFGEEFRGDELNHLIQRGFTRNEERSYRTKDGRRIPVSFSASVMASDEALQGIVCVARDITNRKQAEEVIRRANEELRRLAREL